MRKIEQKLLECFKQQKNFNSLIDKIKVDDKGTKSIYYYNYGWFVYSEQTKEDGTKDAYFCLPSFDGYLSQTTKSRVNTFLNEYGLKVTQKNYKYFCNEVEVKLDKIYFIHKKEDEKYYFSEDCDI